MDQAAADQGMQETQQPEAVALKAKGLAGVPETQVAHTLEQGVVAQALLAAMRQLHQAGLAEAEYRPASQGQQLRGPGVEAVPLAVLEALEGVALLLLAALQTAALVR